MVKVGSRPQLLIQKKALVQESFPRDGAFLRVTPLVVYEFFANLAKIPRGLLHPDGVFVGA